MPPFEILRPPDSALALSEQGAWALHPLAGGRLAGGGVELDCTLSETSLGLRLRSTEPLLFLRLRWNDRIPEGLRYLGDSCLPSRGPLEWRCLVPERPLPWYLLAYDGQHTHGVGVRTGAGALCRWHVDPFGVTLWLDVRNGAAAVRLGDRELHLADVTVRAGRVWEEPFQAARRFATVLDDVRLMPEQPVYGLRVLAEPSLTAERILEEARLLADLAENTVNRPFLLVDATYQSEAAPWMADPAALAEGIAAAGCRPGLSLWPLISHAEEHAALAMPHAGNGPCGTGWVLDPTLPAAEEHLCQLVARAVGQGWRFIRYEGTTAPLLGDPGPFSVPSPHAGRGFADGSLTTAEVLRRLHAAIREATKDRAVLASADAMGHLVAGHVHMHCLSDDSCVQSWPVARLAGVNALGFRGFHHGALYAAGAGAADLSERLPWPIAEQWLRLLASSGTPCFVVRGQAPLDSLRQRAVRSAFAKASRQLPLAEPLDWQATTSPGRWKLGNETVSFDWYSAQYEDHS